MSAHNSVKPRVYQLFIHYSVGLHPLILTKGIKIVCKMCITKIQSVTGKMLCRTSHAGLMRSLNISKAHPSDKLGIVAESTCLHLVILPIIKNIANGRKCHITADSGSLGV